MKRLPLQNTFKEFNTTDTILVICLAITLCLSFGRIISLVLHEDGSHDFHPYWYQGHSLRRGSNPYRAYLHREVPELPVSYIDGVTITNPPVAQGDLSTSVTNTAPLVLLLSLLSFYSWPFAKLNWLAINLILIFFLPWLLYRSFPLRYAFGRSDKLLIILGTFAFAATRGSVAIGQTTLFVFSLLLGVLILRRHHWLLAGVLLGIALSKYSLALPFILFLILEGKKRNWTIIGIALLIQLLGILTMTWLSGDSPLTIVEYYLTIGRGFSTSPDLGVQLGVIFSENSQWILIFSGLITLFVAAGVGTWWKNQRKQSGDLPALAKHVVLIILVIYVFLMAYNGGYDMLVMLLVLPLALFLWRHPEAATMSTRQTKIAICLFLFFQVMLSSPFSIANNLTLQLPYLTFDKWVARMYIVLLLVMLFFLLWLLPRIRVPPLAYSKHGDDSDEEG